MKTFRLQRSDNQLEQAEIAWWNEFSEIENKICWVQTEETRRIIRRGYIDEIVRSIPPSAIIVDYGCGTGWLSVLLAKCGAQKVVGIDSSIEQIKKAESLAKGYEDKIRFIHSDSSEVSLEADVAICHAFLHHLTYEEIRGLIDGLKKVLKPGGVLFLLEPVTGERPLGFWEILPTNVARFLGTWRGFRGQSAEEARLREKHHQRGRGERLPGYGVSPKETPFMVGELESLIAADFELVSVKPVLRAALLIATPVELFKKTFPVFGRFLGAVLLRLGVIWDKLSFKRYPKEGWQGWTFCLFRCVKK